jgi:hypothetical protein
MSGMKQKSWSNRRSVPQSQFNWTEDFAGPRIKTWLSVYMAKLFCINCGTAAAHWMSLTFPVQKKKCAKRQKQKQLWLLELWKHNTTTAYLSHLVDFFKRWLFDSVKKYPPVFCELIGQKVHTYLVESVLSILRPAYQQRPLDHESCTCNSVLSIMRAAHHHAPLSYPSWELQTTVLSILRAAYQCPLESRSWELNTSVLSIMRAEHQCPLDHETWTPVQCLLDRESCIPVSSRSWELHTTMLQCPLDHESCKPLSSRSWDLHTCMCPLYHEIYTPPAVSSHTICILCGLFLNTLDFGMFWIIFDFLLSIQPCHYEMILAWYCSTTKIKNYETCPRAE